ncbi:MAG: sulfurtransferase [Nitrosopumilaceae archaeon]
MILLYSWLAEHLNDDNIVILDSSGNVSYSYAHIPNSQPLGLEKVVKTNQYGADLVLDTEQTAKLFGSLGIDDTKTVIIYGDYLDPSAARIAWTLLYFGHEKTKILDIGIRGWHQKGLPITRDVHKVKPTTFIPKINSALRIEAEDLQKKIDEAVILDARSPQEFIAGRIPNATLLPFTDGVGQSGFLFKDKEDLIKLFEEKQIPKNKELICYCALGHRGANIFTQLKIAGYENVKLYDGSIADWAGRRLPLA